MWDVCAMLDTVDLHAIFKSALLAKILLRDTEMRLAETARDAEFAITELEFATALRDSLVRDASTKLL